MAMAAMRRALTAVFSEDVGSGIADAPATETVFMSSVFRSAGDSSDASDGIDPTSPVSTNDVRFGFSVAGDACFRKACKRDK
jgi:hypothetical protein